MFCRPTYSRHLTISLFTHVVYLTSNTNTNCNIIVGPRPVFFVNDDENDDENDENILNYRRRD